MDSCNKAVMIPVSPRRCGLIASGKEDIEIKKTRPKIEVPFKCYIYCTKKHGVAFWTGPRYSYADDHSHNAFDRCGNGKVIGEFVCDAVIPMSIEYSDPNSKCALKEFPYTCLTDKQIVDYLGNGVGGYGWHISDLKIYDQPKELSDFKHCLSVVEKKLLYDQDLGYAGLVCDGCPHAKWENYHLVQCQNATCASRRVSPPQNLCYVEELKKI